MMTADFKRRYTFFKKHAGSIVGEAALCAFRLARAEVEAEARGFVTDWQVDEDYRLADGETLPDEVWGCIVTAPNGEEDSLWGVCDPTHDYCRVVAAELAAEVLGEIKRKEANDATAHNYQAL